MSISKSRTLSLHSRYDPWREAEKYLIHSQIPLDSKIYVLLEPGNGYLTYKLLETNPNVKIIEVHCSRTYQKESLKTNNKTAGSIRQWCPDDKEDLSSFLSGSVPDFDIGNVTVVEWPPAKHAFGELYSQIKHRVRSFLQERRASIHTTGKFGRLWLRNTLKKFSSLNTVCTRITSTAPLIIAASGPSLQQVLPLLSEIQNSALIISLPSAADALLYYGINPDLLVHSDAGFYANYHLRSLQSTTPVQAAPLHAAGCRSFTAPLLPLSTGSALENYLLHTLKVPALNVSSHGTVAGIAYQIASMITEGPIVFAGLDFCFNDIEGHVRPHSFRHLIESTSHRYEPLHELYFRRSPLADETAQKLNQGPQLEYKNKALQNYALERYAQWFQRLSPELHHRFYRIYPSVVEIPAFHTINKNELYNLCARSSQKDKSGRVFNYETQQINNKAVLTTMFKLTAVLDSQFNQFFSELSSVSHALFQLHRYPLLFELFQYMCLPLLFRMQRNTVHYEEIRDSYTNLIDEIESLIQAVYSE